MAQQTFAGRTDQDREANAKCDHEENRNGGSKDQ
jgi:hypothetical protein